MEIHPYIDRHGKWVAVIITTESKGNYVVPTQHRFTTEPYDSFRELLENLITLKEDEKI